MVLEVYAKCICVSVPALHINCCTTICGINFNTMRPRQNGCNLADDNSKRIFVNEIVKLVIKISLKFVSEGLIDNEPALLMMTTQLQQYFMEPV